MIMGTPLKIDEIYNGDVKTVAILPNNNNVEVSRNYNDFDVSNFRCVSNDERYAISINDISIIEVNNKLDVKIACTFYLDENGSCIKYTYSFMPGEMYDNVVCSVSYDNTTLSDGVITITNDSQEKEVSIPLFNIEKFNLMPTQETAERYNLIINKTIIDNS
jgi:hypothetical protein